MPKSEHRQPSEQPGYTELWLRCPRCQEITKVYWLGLDDFPYITCDCCRQVSASGAFHIVAMAGVAHPLATSYACHVCGAPDCEKDHVTEEVSTLGRRAV